MKCTIRRGHGTATPVVLSVDPTAVRTLSRVRSILVACIYGCIVRLMSSVLKCRMSSRGLWAPSMCGRLLSIRWTILSVWVGLLLQVTDIGRLRCCLLCVSKPMTGRPTISEPGSATRWPLIAVSMARRRLTCLMWFRRLSMLMKLLVWNGWATMSSMLDVRPDSELCTVSVSVRFVVLRVVSSEVTGMLSWLSVLIMATMISVTETMCCRKAVSMRLLLWVEIVPLISCVTWRVSY